MKSYRRALSALATTALLTSGLTAGAAATATAAPTGPYAADLADVTEPILSGLGQVGQTLTLLLPPDLLLVTTQVEWLRDGTEVITGESGMTYVPSLTDVGHTITAKVTPLLLDRPVVSVLTNAVTILPATTDPGDELTALFDTALKQVAGRLGIQRPTWSETGVVETVQWFREKAGTVVPIPDANGWEYLPTPEDSGAQVFAEITGTLGSLPVVKLVTAEFAVPAQPVSATKDVAIDTSEGLTPDAVLTAVPPTWSTDGVTSTYQWRLDGTAIPGATGTTYTIKATDVDKALTVVATGTKEGATPGTSTSAPVTPVAEETITVVTRPSIVAADPRDVDHGETLAVSPATWSAGSTPEISYQWFRGGTPVGTGATYTVQLEDVASRLTVVAKAVRGEATATAASDPVTVDKLMARTNAKLKRKQVRKGQAAVLRIATTAAGIAVPGKVTIFDGGKKLRTVKVGSSAKSVRLKVSRVGRHKIRVVHLGNRYVESSARTVKLVVKRAGR